MAIQYALSALFLLAGFVEFANARVRHQPARMLLAGGAAAGAIMFLCVALDLLVQPLGYLGIGGLIVYSLGYVYDFFNPGERVGIIGAIRWSLMDSPKSDAGSKYRVRGKLADRK